MKIIPQNSQNLVRSAYSFKARNMVWPKLGKLDYYPRWHHQWSSYADLAEVMKLLNIFDKSENHFQLTSLRVSQTV